jgi:hypothetical protein
VGVGETPDKSTERVSPTEVVPVTVMAGLIEKSPMGVIEFVVSALAVSDSDVPVINAVIGFPMSADTVT